jgi:hypothetical protein
MEGEHRWGRAAFCERGALLKNFCLLRYALSR